MELDTDILKIVQLLIWVLIACYDKPVALPNKKIIIIRRMEIFGYEAISTKCYELRQMFASGLKNPWHN